MHPFLGIPPRGRRSSPRRSPPGRSPSDGAHPRRSQKVQESAGTTTLYIDGRTGPTLAQAGKFPLCGDDPFVGHDSSDSASRSYAARYRFTGSATLCAAVEGSESESRVLSRLIDRITSPKRRGIETIWDGRQLHRVW